MKEVGNLYREKTGKGVPSEYDLDSGFLKTPEQWDKRFAEYFADDEGIEQLTPSHWKLIQYARRFFFKYGRSPMPPQYSVYAQMSVKEIYELFPKGLMSIHRLAGLPQPKTC